jgi:hypothetical protein
LRIERLVGNENHNIIVPGSLGDAIDLRLQREQNLASGASGSQGHVLAAESHLIGTECEFDTGGAGLELLVVADELVFRGLFGHPTYVTRINGFWRFLIRFKFKMLEFLKPEALL